MQLGKDEKVRARDKAVEAMDVWLDKFDVVVIGPGLGRDDLILDTIAEVCRKTLMWPPETTRSLADMAHLPSESTDV